jgi:hypothetical protein
VRSAIVIGFAMSHRADNANFVSDFRGLFEVLGKMNALDAGFYGAEGSAIFDGCEHFGIKRFLRGNAAREKDIDNRLRRGFGAGGLGLKFKKVTESQTDAADETDKKELATVRPPNVFGAVAEAGNIVCHTKRQ